MRLHVQTTLSLALLALASAGCADPVVGAECRAGFSASGDRCLPVVMEGDGAVPDAGPFADGGAIDADLLPDGAVRPDAGDRPDGGYADASNGLPDGGTPDGGGPDGCDLGELECGALCVRPDTDRLNCGGCGIECGAGELCSAGTCTAACEDPLVMCGGACVDVATDPDHCGLCGRSCASGICEAGECVGPMPGHVVVVGHDYRTSRRGQNRVAGNAVFLSRGASVHVLAWEGGASPATVGGVDRAIDQVARDVGRSWTKSVALDAGEVPFLLANADVLVVYPQRDAADASLRDLGDRWAVALSSFLDRGGVVVLFDGAGSNAGTWQVLDQAGLFTATGRAEVSGDVLRVVSPGDAVAVGVPLSYRGESATVRFETTERAAVVEHAEGPVVVHRVVTATGG